jgi:hypothetical protein
VVSRCHSTDVHQSITWQFTRYDIKTCILPSCHQELLTFSMSPLSACLLTVLHADDLWLTHATGAGIGGLALAMALHKKDISFTLYEEAEEFSAVG